MKEKDMWSSFIDEKPEYKNSKYEAWCFGGNTVDDVNKLAKLVKDGIKTATASAYELYEIDKEPLPTVGDFNIILDSDKNAICITQTTKVYVCPFDKVSESHAYKEGEGDRSLDYWREVHEKFLKNEIQEYKLSFNDETPIVCEEFKVVYPM